MTTQPVTTAQQSEARPGREGGRAAPIRRHTAEDGPPGSRLARWPIVAFIALAYGLSWWPSFARLANPDSAAMIAIGPSIAAVVIVGWVYGRPARRALLRSAVDPRIGRWWAAMAIPVAVAAATTIIAVLLGAAAPTGSDVGQAVVAAAVSLPIILVINGPLGEELGWRGYLLPRFLRRHSPITATLMLIPLWIAFHLPMIMTSPDRFGPWWALMVVGLAFTMTWLHLRSGGSVLLAVVFHAVVNTSTPAVIQLFGDGDRLLAIRLYAALWVFVGAVAAAGPLRHARTDRRPAAAASHDGGLTSSSLELME
jgi:membrane protease YdiL (CAAX protease family)